MRTDITPQAAHGPKPAGRSRRVPALLGAVALGAVAAAGVLGPAPTTPALAQAAAQANQAMPSFADVVAKVKPAVVSVRVKAADGTSGALPGLGNFDVPGFDLPDDHPLQEFLKRFRGGETERAPRGPRPGPRLSQGSGFFISADGFLVTNNHVIDKSSEVEVLTDDGRTLDAKVVGTDPKTDLALLKVEGKGFPFVELAPQAPRVGDWVVAVGNPFGLGGTVTAGIVSARGRDIGAGPYDDFLQIDAPINRGNSGGPAFNQAGEVVGVNTAIASPSGGNVGVAFAIPSETVQRIVTQLKETGTVARGFLGVQIQPVTKDIAGSLGLSEAEGAIVASVNEGSPAAKAGVKSGDVVLALNGKPVKAPRDLSRAVADLGPDADATLQVWRDGAKREVSVKLGRLSDGRTASADPKGERSETIGPLGLELAPAASVGGSGKEGVAVTDVRAGSPAAEKGFRTGDVIAEVAGRAVETPADVRQALEGARKDGKKAVLFRVVTRDGARFIALEVPTA
jgi:serine protease Do